jgi:TPR repeat protein
MLFISSLLINHLVNLKELHLILLLNVSAADPPKAEDAIRWFYPSSSAGNARAQYNLGLCLQNGKGVKRNQKEAVRYDTSAILVSHTI